MSEKIPANTDHAAAARARLSEASAHLKTAVDLAGTSVRHAAEAAADELKVGREAVGDELGEAGKASKAAAHEAREVASEQVDAALSKGRDLVRSAEALIREKPLAAFGVAFAAGFLLSRLARR
jgi:ElaB/YqjD/DUF883 family membrane-anchored ribosome-binding protein